jgi:glycosyltransferase involved in cell wall biosynthesis
MKVLFITQYDEQGASSRCRVYQYLPHLAAQGIEGEVISRTPTAAELRQRAGAVAGVFLQKRVLPLTRLLALRRQTHRLWFDFDDAIWLRRADDGRVRLAPLHKRLRLAATLRLADGVIAGNEYLAAYARHWNPNITVLSTPIDSDYYAVRNGEPDLVWSSGHQVIRSSLCLGWVGHPDNLCYLRRLEPALAAVARLKAAQGGRTAHGSECRVPGKDSSEPRTVVDHEPPLMLRVVCSEPFESAALPIENIPWSLAEEVANLRAFDIGLMPLEDDPWTRGKCGYKALQYMAVGVPSVCSPVGMNADIIMEDENGLLADSLPDWERQLTRLIESPELRRRLGEAGRRSVEQRYSLTALAPRLADVLTS